MEFDDERADLIDLDDDEHFESLEETRPGGLVALEPGPDERNERLDKFVAGKLPDQSRSFIQRLIDEEQILVDGVPRRRTFKVTPGETITVQIPVPEIVPLEPENIPLSIIYEDDDILVIDKPAGMVVHPAPGHARSTLVNALLHHLPGIAVSGTNRPGIVHRLDRDTSGVMVVAKSDRGRASLIAQWMNHEVEKAYVALVRGIVEPDVATIDVPIGRDPKDRQRMAALSSGRDARTHLVVNQRLDPPGATLLDLEIETGRTHQIRVHLAYIGHPVVGDPIYNRASGPLGGTNAISPRQFLHAQRLGFSLPNGERVTFEAPLPEDLSTVVRELTTPNEEVPW